MKSSKTNIINGEFSRSSEIICSLASLPTRAEFMFETLLIAVSDAKNCPTIE